MSQIFTFDHFFWTTFFGPLLESRISLLAPHPLYPIRAFKVENAISTSYTNQEISTQLALSIKSIETYRSRLMEKLELKSRAELVRYVMDRELLTPPMN